MADGPEEIGAKVIGPDPLGAQMALDAATADEAREYLRRQNDIAALQIENLRKQDEYETSHLRWRRFNDQMRGALQIVLVIVGVAILIACGAAGAFLGYVISIFLDIFLTNAHSTETEH